MSEDDALAAHSRLRSDLATAVASAAAREQQLQAELDARYAETAELTRQLMAAKKRAARAKRQVTALKAKVQAQEAVASQTVRAKLRRRFARVPGES